MVDRVRPIWPLLILFASGAMLATAVFYFQGQLGLQPCPLCMQQRYWHWAVMGVSALAFIATRVQPKWMNWAIVIVGLVLLGSAAMGAYHVAVEQKWVVAQCDVGGAVNAHDLSLRASMWRSLESAKHEPSASAHARRECREAPSR